MRYTGLNFPRRNIFMDPTLLLILASLMLLTPMLSDAQPFYYQTGPDNFSVYKPSERGLASACGGTFNSTITSIIDGSTLKVRDCSRRVHLAFVETPDQTNKTWYRKARINLKNICPIGSTVTIDSDRGKKYDPYGRLNAVVYCGGAESLNSIVLYNGWGRVDTQYCDRSEFGNYSWALEGCRKKSGSR